MFFSVFISVGIILKVNDGLIINNVLINVIIIVMNCLFFIFFCRNKVEKIIIKNGLSLLSILVFDKINLLIE